MYRSVPPSLESKHTATYVSETVDAQPLLLILGNGCCTLFGICALVYFTVLVPARQGAFDYVHVSPPPLSPPLPPPPQTPYSHPSPPPAPPLHPPFAPGTLVGALSTCYALEVGGTIAELQVDRNGCQDGGEGSVSSVCPLGTDFPDCPPRQMPFPPPLPPGMPPPPSPQPKPRCR